MARIGPFLLIFFFLGSGALIIASIIRRKRIERQLVHGRMRNLWAQLQVLTSAGADTKEQFPVVLDLRRLGRPAIPFLVEQWTRNPSAHLADQAWSALWGIASSRTPELIPTLLEKLSDRNFRIRYQAIRILEQIGPKAREAIPDLRRIMDEDENVNAQSAAILALKAITGIRA